MPDEITQLADGAQGQTRVQGSKAAFQRRTNWQTSIFTAAMARDEEGETSAADCFKSDVGTQSDHNIKNKLVWQCEG